MKELIKRLKLESPSFFKKVLALCVTLGAIGTAFIAGKDYLPAITQVVAPYLITAGIVGAAVAKTTVKNPEELQ